MNTIASSILMLAVLVAAVVFAFWIGEWPWRIAKRRGHPNSDAIRVCGLIGLVFWPCLVVAFIWAFTKPNK